MTSKKLEISFFKGMPPAEGGCMGNRKGGEYKAVWIHAILSGTGIGRALYSGGSQLPVVEDANIEIQDAVY